MHVTPQPPKRGVDRAVLGDCQRCSPLTQTYGKSAGMVWGQRDHFCDIRFLSVHMRLLQLRRLARVFCCKLVGASKDAWHSNFRYRSFPVKSQSSPSLGAYAHYIGAGSAREPPNPKTTGRLGGPGDLPKVQPAHPDIWKVSRHGLGAAGPVP